MSGKATTARNNNIIKLNLENETIEYIKNLENKIQKQAERLSNSEEYKCQLESILLAYEPNTKLPIKPNYFYNLIEKAKETSENINKFNCIKEDLEKVLNQKKKIAIDFQEQIEKLSLEKNNLLYENSSLKANNLSLGNKQNDNEKIIEQIKYSFDKQFKDICNKLNFSEMENSNLKAKNLSYSEQLLSTEEEMKVIQMKNKNLENELNSQMIKFETLQKEKGKSFKESSSFLIEINKKDELLKIKENEIEMLKLTINNADVENHQLIEKNKLLLKSNQEKEKENLKLLKELGNLKSNEFLYNNNQQNNESYDIILQQKKSICYFKSLIEQNEEINKNLTEKNKEIQLVLDKQNFELTTIKKEKEKLEVLFEQREESKKLTIDNLENQLRERENKENSFNNLKLELIGLNEENKLIKINLSNNKEIYESEIATLIENYNTLHNSYDSLNNDYSNLLTTNNKLSTKIESLEKSISEFKNNDFHKDNKLIETNSKIDKIVLDYYSLQDENEKLNNENNNITIDNKHLSSEILKLNSIINNLEKEQEDFKSLVFNDLIDLFNIINKKDEGRKNQINTSIFVCYSDYFSSLKNYINNQIDTLLSNEAKIIENNSKITDSLNKISQLEQSILNTTNEKEVIFTKYQQMKELLNTININLTNQKSEYERLYNRHIELIENNKKQEEEIISLKEKHDSLNQHLSELEESMTNLENRNIYLEEYCKLLIENRKFLEKYTYTTIKHFIPELYKSFSELISFKESVFKYENEKIILLCKLNKLENSESNDNNELESSILKEKNNLKELLTSYDQKIENKKETIFNRENEIKRCFNNTSLKDTLNKYETLCSSREIKYCSDKKLNDSSSILNRNNIFINQSNSQPSIFADRKNNISEILNKIESKGSINNHIGFKLNN